jgi:hypothetical protein
MWQHVVDEEGGRLRLYVIGHFSDGLCSSVNWNFIFLDSHVNASMVYLSCGDRIHFSLRCFGKKGSQHSCLETQSKEANICASIMEIQTNFIKIMRNEGKFYVGRISFSWYLAPHIDSDLNLF